MPTFSRFVGQIFVSVTYSSVKSTHTACLLVGARQELIRLGRGQSCVARIQWHCRSIPFAGQNGRSAAGPSESLVCSRRSCSNENESSELKPVPTQKPYRLHHTSENASSERKDISVSARTRFGFSSGVRRGLLPLSASFSFS